MHDDVQRDAGVEEYSYPSDDVGIATPTPRAAAGRQLEGQSSKMKPDVARVVAYKKACLCQQEPR